MLMNASFFFFFLFSIETTNEIGIGRGNCFAFEMLIRFSSEITVRSHGNTKIAELKTQLIHMESPRTTKLTAYLSFFYGFGIMKDLKRCDEFI